MEVICYTRLPEADILYANRLAYSMHLAWRAEDEKFLPFHHNEGILYAKATRNVNDGTLTAKSLKNPWIFRLGEHAYGVAAVRTEANGEKDSESEGKILIFKSYDLVHYEEIGMWRLQEKGYICEVRLNYNEENATCLICWKDEDGIWWEGEVQPGKGNTVLQESIKKVDVPQIAKAEFLAEEVEQVKGICPGNSIEVSDEEGNYLIKKLTVPVCVKMALSKEGLTSMKELKSVRAVASYSDGTVVERKVDWELDGSGVIETRRGSVIRGRVHQEHFDEPFAESRADPCCMYWHGKYYYIATNDADDNHTLYIRCADTLEEIMTAEEVLLLDSVTYPGISGLLWAPEFHEIGGNLYIFHAATSGEFFWEESRVMKLRDGGDPMCRFDWSAPQLVVKKDGSPLCEEGKVISLDMTTFAYQGGVYAMWSQRQFLPVDQGAWLYLAQIDEKEPWKLISDPVCIAVPEYGWENNHTFVVEGPYALERNGQLMLTYSGAAVDATYAVGLLKPKMGSDILNPNNWKKSNYPLLSSRSQEGQYGPGHNSYLTDENGFVWNFYHARKGVEAPRSSFARRVHFDVDGEPMLDVLEKMDLPKALRQVDIQIWR